MAVISVKQLWTDYSAEDTLDRHRTYSEGFQVISDDILDDGTIIGGNSQLPRLGNVYAKDSGAICIRVAPRRNDENPYLWTVIVDYDTELPFKETQSLDPTTGTSAPTPSPTQRAENPTQRPPVFKFGHTTFRKIALVSPGGVLIEDTFPTTVFDSNVSHTIGKPPKMVVENDGSVSITNSAGDPFDPQIEVEEAHLTIDVTWAAGFVNTLLLATYVNCVNATAWRGLAARTCIIRANEATSTYENGENYWQRHAMIEVNPDTWDIPILDRGTREWVPPESEEDPLDTGEYRNFTNSDGTPATELLDGQGRRLGTNPPQSPTYLYYRYYREIDFDATLSLPT